MNLYTELIESQKGKERYCQPKRPGLRVQVTPESNRVRGMLELNDQLFVAIGATPYTIDPSFTATAYGTIANDGLQVTMASNRTQAVMCSAGSAYLLEGGNPAVEITWMGEPVSSVCQVNGYFLFLASKGDGFFFSEPGDANSGDSTNFITSDASANKYIAMIAINQEAVLFGTRIIQFYAPNDTGAILAGAAPFVARLGDGTIEFGIDAPAAILKADNALFFLGGDATGRGTIRRLTGYTPFRVSDHGVEVAIRKMQSIYDTVAYAYQEDGHTFIVFNFISNNQTWVMDVESGHWHQRDFWNEELARSEAHRGYCGTSAFGKIIIGDHTNGNIYAQSLDYFSDRLSDTHDNVIRWVRRSSDTNSLNRLIRFGFVEILIQAGVGDGSNGDPAVGTVTPEFDPQMMVSWTDDNGQSTPSNEYQRSMGKLGEFSKRVYINGCGQGRNRVWNLSGTAKTRTCLLGAVADVRVLSR